jgi:hypothetical protein
MKGKSYYVRFLAALLVGFGLVGGANAATISTLEVTSPDSGAIRGIDSVFVVTAKVIDITRTDSLEIIMYLASGNDSTVVSDTLNTGTTWGGKSQSQVVLMAGGGNPFGVAGSGTLLRLKDAQSGLVATSLVAVQQKSRRVNAFASRAHKGDADSVVIAVSNDTTTFKWYGRVNGSAGTMSNVHVAALVIDDDNGTAETADTSAVSLSTTTSISTRAKVKFTVDADRPVNPESLFSNTPGGGNTVTVAGMNRTVLGIGDSLVVRSKLGNSVANSVLLSDSLNVHLDVFNKSFAFNKGSRSVDTLRINVTLAEGSYGDLDVSHGASGNSDTLGVFIVDKAGNRSGNAVVANGTLLDGVPFGVTTAVTFLFDTKKPALDSTNGDTILPVSTDTITDGTISLQSSISKELDNLYVNDINKLEFKLAEALDTLFVTFSGASKLVLKAHAATKSTTDASLGLATTASRQLDFTQYGNTGNSDPASQDSFWVATTDGGSPVGMTKEGGTAADTLLTTGMHTITFQAQDLAGNVGPTLSRTNVYIDVDDIDLVRLFPTKSAFGSVTATRNDTIEEETSKLVFKLSEPADSVLISYVGITGAGGGVTRTRRLSGTQLTNTSTEQTLPVDSLSNGTLYQLTVLARDLAGNFTRSSPDTFLYDTSFVVPKITRFTVESSVKGLGPGSLTTSHAVAGSEITLTISADASTDGTRAAVTYKSAAILKVAGGRGVTLKGTGVTDNGSGRATLNSTDWVTGSRTITLKDTAGIDTLKITIVDSTTSGGPFTGALDSSIVYDPEAFSQVLVSAPDTVDQATEFWVGLTLSDTYKNTRILDNRYVDISANKLGITVPTGDQLVLKGTGGFWAKSMGWSGSGLVFDVKDVIPTQTTAVVAGSSDKGDHQIDGKSNAIYVRASGTASVDAPNELVAEDYMGADGLGDQGGFVMLTFDLSTDHATADAYRVYRQVQVTQRLATASDSTEATIVALAAPEAAMIPWAKIDAVPGETIGRVIVATLDNVATSWGVAAERNGQTTKTKAALASVETVNPYEVMAQTMMQSQQLAVQSDVPVFATLLPEAMAFAQQGVAPRLKSVEESIVRSNLTQTVEPVRAIDNIAPTAVPYVRALDTPSDAGSSITLKWTKSEDDRMLPRSASNAVGLGTVSDMVAGVKGYNVYRKVGATGEFTLVGKASSGETSFADPTALNGVRYTYTVAPYDEDNVTTSEMERTAMAIRNNAVDSNGKVVFGLYGADNQVGFDDFFIFADNFGLTAADEMFEPAFDLAPGAGTPKVDFDDFFVFADNFGRGIEASGKVVPMLSGLNADARLYLETAADLPRVGEEVVIDVDLADYVELQGYGLSVSYDADKLEFVRAIGGESLLGEGELAAPRVITQVDGLISIAAYGETATEGELGMSLVFRTTSEIENSFVEVTDSQVRDGNFAVNTVALPAPVQIQTRPEAFALANNYPNPFNPATTIKYALPEASTVRLEVFNVVGQVVRTLVADHQNAGRYVVQWDAANDNGHSLSSGIYFYRLQAGSEFLEVKKMLLLK